MDAEVEKDVALLAATLIAFGIAVRENYVDATAADFQYNIVVEALGQAGIITFSQFIYMTGEEFKDLEAPIYSPYNPPALDVPTQKIPIGAWS